MTIKGTEVKQS